MSLKTLLLATTGLVALAFATAAYSQDAALTTAYEAYVTAESGTDADAKTAAAAAFLAECTRVGTPDIKECIALVNSGAAPAADPAAPPADQPAASEAPAPAADEPASAPKADQPATEPPATEQPAAAPPATEQPAAEKPTAEQPAAASPVDDPALVAAYKAYVSASSGTDSAAKTSSESALLVECTRLGVANLDECLALFPAGSKVSEETPKPAVSDDSAQPLEVIPNQQSTDGQVAPVLDSAKDAATVPGATPQNAAPADQAPAPATDADAQAAAVVPDADVAATVETEGKPITELPVETPTNAQVVQKTDDNRFVLKFNLQLSIYTPYDDRDRIGRDGDEVVYQQLDDGRVRQVVTRKDGTKVITIWNRYGEIERRVKVRPDGTRIILAYDTEVRDGQWRDPGDDLPAFRLSIPVEQYVLYSDSADEEQIQLFLAEPPLEKATRIYSVDDVKRSARLRDTVRRVEIGDLTFDTDKATIAPDQVGSLSKVGNAIQALLEQNPGEVFLVEGHTDAVGSDEHNLDLSDRRAETVARLLTDLYDIPPENLVTQGYGERYLKVETQGEERANRRATVRRITSLVAPVAQ